VEGSSIQSKSINSELCLWALKDFFSYKNTLKENKITWQTHLETHLV